MADDGLLLNFAPEDTFRTAKAAPKFKGGSWRDRLRAEKSAKRRKESREPLQQRQPSQLAKAQPSVNDPSTRPPPHEFADPRPTKRLRRPGDFAQSSPQSHAFSSTEEPHSQRQQQPIKSKEVISSLFSYNPKPSTAVESTPDAAHDIPSKPSNAPLVDGIDTFTSLGLSPVLATHLMTKMNLEKPTAIQKSAISQLIKEYCDAFIQSETGSGKTLAYLLPIVQQIMMLSGGQNVDTKSENNSGLHRNSGLFAIIVAPTRELCKQISVVLERVLGCAHYIVAGTVIGGEKKKSEKARLRKGLNILVATPGRLVDHLQSTKVLDVGLVRWLVLDEGDRLMELGFEKDISEIVQGLDRLQRQDSTIRLPSRRLTILCSATMKMNVQRLGEMSLRDAILIKGDAEALEEKIHGVGNDASIANFLAPAQLKQSYVVVAPKLRLVTLTALLRRTFARKGSVMKAIVFVSCADSVEFHFRVFSREHENHATEEASSLSGPGHAIAQSSPNHDAQSTVAPSSILATTGSQISPLTLYKLHGSLPQATRTATVRAFSRANAPSLLIATDVASRGLDLPNLDLVIEYDPPFSSDDHLHRIGRTARVGREGRATIFLLPGCEEGYVEILKRSYKASNEGLGNNVTQTLAEDLLRKGFYSPPSIAKSTSAPFSTTASPNWEQHATEFQLDVERWVLESPNNKEVARRAFQSHIRAYATHIASERQWFDLGQLHLGHLAKAFGLRDKPGEINLRQNHKGKGKERQRKTTRENNQTSEAERREVDRGEGGRPEDAHEASKKMRRKVQNRHAMMGGGADEFNIA